MKTLVTASILSANFGSLQSEVDAVSTADWLQLDVMDGHFVPNLSFGAPVAKGLKTSLLLDAHLMVSNPAERITEFLSIGVKHITFHAEAVPSTAARRSLITSIRAASATAGIALNPDTPVSAIDDVVDDIDLVLIMSVHPGFSGQSFIPSVLEKVRTLRTRYPNLMIQIDGGITPDTARLAREAGANNLVAASAVFGAKDRAAAIQKLRGS
ncbi:MAG: ribulose-phosphate 3-epimerase [Candidatus Peribacteraceae bacterium]